MLLLSYWSLVAILWLEDFQTLIFIYDELPRRILPVNTAKPGGVFTLTHNSQRHSVHPQEAAWAGSSPSNEVDVTTGLTRGVCPVNVL